MTKFTSIVLAVATASFSMIACDDSKAEPKGRSKAKSKAVSGCTSLHDAIYYAERHRLTESEAMETVRVEVMSDPAGGYVVERLPPDTKVHIVRFNEKRSRYQIDMPVDGWISPDDLGPRIPSEKHCK